MTAPEDTIGIALRDFALDQLAQVDMQLARAGAWQHTGVHEARKAVARLRACVELLRKSPLADRTLERRLRSFAHGLSPLRDTQAALAAARTLRRHTADARAEKIWQRLIRELKARRERVLGAALMIDPGFASHRGQMAEMRAPINTIAWTRLQPSELVRALEHSTKRAHRARAPALESIAEMPRHRLRRRSRRLLLQIKLLHAIAHDVTRPCASGTAHDALHHALGKSLKRKRRTQLVGGLGWEQDLRVLRRALPIGATASWDRNAVTILRQALAQAQSGTNKLLD